MQCYSCKKVTAISVIGVILGATESGPRCGNYISTLNFRESSTDKVIFNYIRNFRFPYFPESLYGYTAKYI